MVNSIQDLPPVALSSGTNFQPLFKEASAEQKDRKPKDVQKSADNNLLNKAVDDSKNNKEQDKNVQADYSKLTEKLQNMITNENLNLEFSVDKETKKMIIKVVDSQTKEVVRQYPPDVTLKIARFVASTLEHGNVTNARI